jgi:acyl-CoA thioester hydrolase
MFQHETYIRVRYSETDQMGFVYYGHYATYFEVARVEALRSIGCPYKSLEDVGILMPVTEYSIRYLKPGKYDDLLKIITTIEEFPMSRIRFNYKTFNEAGEQLNHAFTELVFLSAEQMRPGRVPEFIRSALQPYFQTGI